MLLHYQPDFHPDLANLCKRLRCHLGGDRPSQTTRLTLSLDRINCPKLGLKHNQGGISHCDSTEANAPASKSPTYSTQIMLKPNARL